MAKGKNTAGVDLPLPTSTIGVTKSELAYQAMRDGIVNGLLQAGDRLPSTRVLSQRWGVGRGTLESVFERLQLEGYITRKVGAGSRVSATIPDRYLKAVNTAQTKAAHHKVFAVVEEGPIGAKQHYQAKVGVLFVARLASPLLISPAEWAAHLQRAMSAMQPEQMCSVGPQGAWVLREQIAKYLRNHRGIDCLAEQVLITNGIRHSIDLLARCVIKT